MRLCVSSALAREFAESAAWSRSCARRSARAFVRPGASRAQRAVELSAARPVLSAAIRNELPSTLTLACRQIIGDIGRDLRHALQVIFS
jgi:hypothetical protein